MSDAIATRKAFFLSELETVYRERIGTASRAEGDAELEAEHAHGEARSREDREAAALQVRIAAGHRKRRQEAKRELESLIAFSSRGLPRFVASSPVDLGALVDVSIETEDGPEERTLFLLPVGAGNELSGPGGDGFISVITPASPVGRALRGSHVGDALDVSTGGRVREWTVVDLV